MVTLGRFFPVHAGCVLALLVGVAHAAIDARQLFRMGQLGYLGVACRALQGGMRRGFQGSGMEAGRHAWLALPHLGVRVMTSGAILRMKLGGGLPVSTGRTGHDRESQAE